MGIQLCVRHRVDLEGATAEVALVGIAHPERDDDLEGLVEAQAVLLPLLVCEKLQRLQRVADGAAEPVGGCPVGVRQTLHASDDIGVDLMRVRNDRAAGEPLGELREASLGQDRRLDAEADRVHAYFLERGARHGDAGLGDTGDGLCLGLLEAGARCTVEVGELGAAGVVDTTALHLNLRNADDAVERLALTEVVDRLGRGTPATGGDE